MAPRPPFPLFSQIAKKVFFNDEGLLKDMLSLTLTLGWKNEKRPSGPIELDLEAGNLVNTVVATMTFTSVKPSISPSNLAQNANPGTVLKTARPEDSKTPPTC